MWPSGHFNWAETWQPGVSVHTIYDQFLQPGLKNEAVMPPVPNSLFKKKNPRPLNLLAIVGVPFKRI